MYRELLPQRLTQVGILRALTWPGFFLSTFLGSRVMQPAMQESAEIFVSCAKLFIKLLHEASTRTCVMYLRPCQDHVDIDKSGKQNPVKIMWTTGGAESRT